MSANSTYAVDLSGSHHSRWGWEDPIAYAMPILPLPQEVSRPIQSTLTSRDYATIELRLFESLAEGDYFCLFAQYATTKLADAEVVPTESIPSEIATAGSRIIFSAGALRRQSRILIHRADQSTVGLTLPILTFMGLALIGMRAGQTASFLKCDGSVGTVMLHSIEFQPEAAARPNL